MKAHRVSLSSRWPWRRLLVAAVGATVLLVGVMGFAHTPAGRPLLGTMGRLFKGPACPLGYDKFADPRQREKARLRFAASQRGADAAAARPALGFDLDRTSRAEVVSVMAARGVACRSGTSAADLVCESVPMGALTVNEAGATAAAGKSTAGGDQAKRNVWFNFGPTERLVSVVALSRHAHPQPASAAFAGVVGAVTRDAGPATNVSGDATASALAAGALRQASAEFRFSNYYASARATNMGASFLLTEEYRSLVN